MLFKNKNGNQNWIKNCENLGLKSVTMSYSTQKNFDSEKTVGGSVTLIIETYYLVLIIVNTADVIFSS